MIVPMLVLGAVDSRSRSRRASRAALFAGDARRWLQSAMGLTYDQRNSLVVGLAMGFAVIPIIFTISEDAFASVPSNLSAASLALGASRWQTAVRVVFRRRAPGVFSAIMIGFGRAVGETMIVLMATGNTPVLDWSIFNGFRTLSANIAVEIPEAPQGGTLYRTLFLVGRAAVHHDVHAQHHCRDDPPASARAVQGGLMALRETFRRGDPAIWFTGTGLGISILMIAGMIGAHPGQRPRVLLAQAAGAGRRSRTAPPCWARSWPGKPIPGRARPTPQAHPHAIKLGNRDLSGADFRWVDEVGRSIERTQPTTRRTSNAASTARSRHARQTAGGRTAKSRRAPSRLAALQPLIAKAAETARRSADSSATRSAPINAASKPNAWRRRARCSGEAPGSGRSHSVSSAAIGAAARRTRGKRAATLEDQACAQVNGGHAALSVVLAAADGKGEGNLDVDIFRAYRANELSFGRAVRDLRGPLVGVPARRSARIEHRRRNLSRRSSAP